MNVLCKPLLRSTEVKVAVLAAFNFSLSSANSICLLLSAYPPARVDRPNGLDLTLADSDDFIVFVKTGAGMHR